MNCTVELIIGGESIPIILDMDSSLIPSLIDLNFIKLFPKDEKTQSLIEEKLLKTLLEGIIGKTREKEDFEDGYLIANFTAKDVFLSSPPSIQALFPDLSDSELKKIKVRIVDNFKDYGKNLIIKKSVNGEDIYILNGEFLTFKNFAKHIAITDAINNKVLNKLDKDSKELEILNKILSKVKFKGVKDLESLLNHFIKNKSKYSGIRIQLEEGNFSASNLLNSILPTIEGIYYKKNNKYSTPFLQNLFAPGGITYSNNIPQIHFHKFFDILAINYSLSMFKNKEEFNTLMKSNEKPEKVIKFFEQFGIKDIENNEDENYFILFTELFKTERGYPYRYLKVDSKGVIKFESTYYLLGETYGATYDTILLMDEDSYRGWHIYHDLEKDEYFISQYELLRSSYGQAKKSLEEAKLAIDKKISEQTFKVSFMSSLFNKIDEIEEDLSISIEVNKDFDTLLKGNVISILAIYFPKNIAILDNSEHIISGNYNIEDFLLLVESWPAKDVLIKDGQLIKEVNTVLKAGIFLSYLNYKYQNLLRTPELIEKVLKEIKEAPTREFYVEKVTKLYMKDKKGNIVSRGKQIKLTRLPDGYDEDIYLDYKKLNGFQYPVIALWEKIGETLNPKFKTNLNIKTLDEIEDLFGKEYSLHKAFIIGNQIYINSTLASTEDLFHEYIHIIMGYLKNNNPEAYSQLLKDVWNNTSNSDKRKLSSGTLYKEYSYEAKLEENFIIKFSDYIFNHGGDTKLREIFESSEILEDSYETIFDKASVNLKEASKRGVSEIFSRFSSEVQMALKNNDKLFSGYASSDLFRLSNKKTNLLKKWISEGTLEEFNCV